MAANHTFRLGPASVRGTVTDSMSTVTVTRPGRSLMPLCDSESQGLGTTAAPDSALLVSMEPRGR